MRVLDGVADDANVLDLGCGNGGVAAELVARGLTGRYVGIDFSFELLAEAKKKIQSPNSNIELVQADLTGEFDRLAGIRNQKFENVFAFATLHHIPGDELHLMFLQRVSGLLAEGGRFVLSNWQFLNSPRLKERIQPWEVIGLRERDVDAGDYLLDWRSGEKAFRYVHHFSENELASLAAQTGFKIADTFYSDGENGKLGLYEIWIK